MTNIAFNLNEQNNDNKQAIADTFGRAAKTYDQHAEFQRDVGHRLLARLPSSLVGAHVLDLGCGTGYFSQQLAMRGAKVTCADLSADMLQQANVRCQGQSKVDFQQADAEQLPFENHTFDIVFSSLALQWCDDLSVPLKEIKRVTKPGGSCLFSTLAEGSLFELANAWAEIDSYQHVNQFLSEKAIKIALAQSGCHNYQLDLPQITLWYGRALELMRDLKGIGATHVSGRAHGLGGKQLIQRVEQAYSRFQNTQGRLPATYHVCLGVIQL